MFVTPSYDVISILPIWIILACSKSVRQAVRTSLFKEQGVSILRKLRESLKFRHQFSRTSPRGRVQHKSLKTSEYQWSTPHTTINQMYVVRLNQSFKVNLNSKVWYLHRFANNVQLYCFTESVTSFFQTNSWLILKIPIPIISAAS